MARGAGSTRVVVVGGGVLGVSTAVHLARAGARVQLVTAHGLASGASGRSLAWLNSSGLRSPAFHELRLLGMQRYRAYDDRGAASSYLRFGGGLRWAPPGDAERLREAHAHMQQIGYPSEWLSAAQVAARVPGVDAGAVPPEGAVLNPTEGWVDLPSLVADLAREIVALGGDIATDADHADVVVRGDRVTRVTTDGSGRFDADVAVLATGAGVPPALAELGITVPDATPTALLVRTAPVQTGLRAVLNTPRVAMRPTPDGRLVMDSGWSEREVVTHDDETFEVRDETVQELLREGSAVLAGNPRLVLDSCGVGPKPIPGDGEPVLGAVEGIAGYHVAFTHSGATLGLIAGELIADEIVRGKSHPLLEPFRPDRFIGSSTLS